MRRHYYPTERDHHEKEGRLNEYRLAKSLTIQEVSEKTGVSPGVYCALNNGTLSPIYAKSTDSWRAGEVRPVAMRLANFFDADPADLWPRYLCGIRRGEVNDEDVAESLHPSMLDRRTAHQQLARGRLWATIREELTPVQYETLAMRARGCTLGDVGKRLNLSRGRVQQIQRKAEARLRHESREVKLLELIHECFD